MPLATSTREQSRGRRATPGRPESPRAAIGALVLGGLVVLLLAACSGPDDDAAGRGAGVWDQAGWDEATWGR